MATSKLRTLIVVGPVAAALAACSAAPSEDGSLESRDALDAPNRNVQIAPLRVPLTAKACPAGLNVKITNRGPGTVKLGAASVDIKAGPANVYTCRGAGRAWGKLDRTELAPGATTYGSFIVGLPESVSQYAPSKGANWEKMTLEDVTLEISVQSTDGQTAKVQITASPVDVCAGAAADSADCKRAAAICPESPTCSGASLPPGD